MPASALARARDIFSVAGYETGDVESSYQVWLGGPHGTAAADLMAFGRQFPHDMSTATVAVCSDGIERGFDIARAVAAPYVMTTSGSQLDLWIAEPSKPILWHENLTREAAETLEPIRPAAALSAKVGLRQLPLFDIPVDLLAGARDAGADRLGPIVASALSEAGDALGPTVEASGPPHAKGRHQHRAAARLVVGALTVLVLRDQGSDRRRLRTLRAESLIEHLVRAYPQPFDWWSRATSAEATVFADLIAHLGDGVDYQSLDPAILSEVYEQALVDDDDRRMLGIHYTPPQLARRLLRDLPVELVPPAGRHILDPCCGSGTLLVAAHDRLRELQPTSLSADDRGTDLTFRVHGYDKDPFAVEIARLTLFLHAQPAKNRWHVEEADTLSRHHASEPVTPNVIVTNPPWKFTSSGSRSQAADAFLEWSMDALEPGGLLGVLMPASWLSAGNSSSTRARLTNQFEVFETWRLPEGAFATSSVATAVVMARKNDGLGGRGARVVREVSRRTLEPFFRGEVAAAQAWLTESSAGLEAGAPAPTVHSEVRSLESVADILSGSQPKPGLIDRGEGIPYLRQFRLVAPYGQIDANVLWHVDFPGDFQAARGGRIIGRPKVLTSAARSSNTPWRFRVAVDQIGVGMGNSMRGVAPRDEGDRDMLYALAIVIGSGFASTFAAQFGGDRNISAGVLRKLPIPASRDSIRRLAVLGRRATELASDKARLSQHLKFAESVVWDIYGVSQDDREVSVGRLAGHSAPEGAPRYPAMTPSRSVGAHGFRRVGAVLTVSANKLVVWVNGLTGDEGTEVSVPAQMPGWMARPGATFDVLGVESVGELDAGLFRFQPMAWRDLDLDNPLPSALLPR